MKAALLAVSVATGLVAGCADAPFSRGGLAGTMPECFAANYDAGRELFTLMDAGPDAANQQCLLTVWPDSGPASPARLTAGTYTASIADGGGGGAGGTAQGFAGEGDKGGGGGGGAGARETLATVELPAGVYKLTLGAGGPGGSACMPAPFAFSGGPGWLGSPSNIVRVATGEVVLGMPGADKYARPSRRQNDIAAGPNRDGHGGSGPGQAAGGDGGHLKSEGTPKVIAEAGDSKSALGRTGTGGAAGFPATDQSNTGGGGGEGNSHTCDAGARGGNGYIALRRN